MALNLDLANIVNNKPAGTYFLYYDRSLVPELVSSSGLRILVGQSRVGAVNTLTYHDTWTNFKSYYGDIDRTLERDGSYFHRSAFEMLNTGVPIACINLRSFDDEQDLSGKLQLALSSDKNNLGETTVPFRSLFNTERFWKVDIDAVVDNTELDAFFSIANVGSSRKSIFIRKSFDSGIDDVTIESYYANTLNKTVPSYLYPKDKINDTFVDIFVFDKDLTNMDDNKANSQYGYLFTDEGIVRSTTGTLSEATDGLTQLSQISESGFVGVYTGSLIPDLTDSAGNNISVVNQINLDFTTVGLMAGINKTVLDNASRWTPTVDVDDNIVYASNGGKQVLPIDFNGHNLWNTEVDGSIDVSNYDNQVIETASYVKTTKHKTVDYNDIKLEDLSRDIDITAINIVNPWLVGNVTPNGSNFDYSLAETSKMYMVDLMPIRIGDKYVGKDSNLSSVTSLEYKGTTKILVGVHTNLMPLQADGTIFPQDAQGEFIYPVGHAQAGQLVEFDSSGAPLDAPLSDGGSVIARPTLTQAQIDALKASHGTDKNVYLVSFDKPLYMGVNVSETNVAERPELTIELNNSETLQIFYSSTSQVISQLELEEMVSAYKPFKMRAYKQRREQFVNNTASRQREVLNVLVSELGDALADRERIDFRYLVDGFKSYIENNLKSEFTQVIKNRNVGATIINAPSINEFRNSTDPYFKQTVDGKFNAEYIFRGGNTSLPYTQTFSLASPKQGANHGYYYAPWFNVNDNGSDMIMPPAPFVSNNFIAKSNSGNPYEAVFGTDYGTVIGTNIKSLEYDFTDEDRKWLEKSGINPILFRAGGGNIILGNRTGFTQNTALKYAHVNELMIQIYEQMRPIALFLLGKKNTAQNRLTVKTRMDNVMRPIQAQGAVDYYENIVNDKNNTGEIISNALGVMDTIIVPSYVNEKVVHRLVVNRTTSEITNEIL
ncbi:tail sheath [Tenacibaculum phage pT24]|uniref:Tail sheath n=1 Tax=Tenacibaculum phage pT24 TaxID=1880590 RepID=A0A1B4XWR9_9CAUD|nr:tail sheath [Tenacibaculum phage pT24]BAV39260.1 tail sheath [Tenacibaculum phage pT24]